MEVVEIVVSGRSLENILRYNQAASITICLRGLSNEFTDPCLFPLLSSRKPVASVEDCFPLTAELIHWLTSKRLFTTEQRDNMLEWIKRLEDVLGEERYGTT